jgi:hypothetical protein
MVNNGSSYGQVGQKREYGGASEVLRASLTLTRNEGLALDALVNSVCDCGLILTFDSDKTNPEGSLI